MLQSEIEQIVEQELIEKLNQSGIQDDKNSLDDSEENSSEDGPQITQDEQWSREEHFNNQKNLGQLQSKEGRCAQTQNNNGSVQRILQSTMDNKNIVQNSLIHSKLQKMQSTSKEQSDSESIEIVEEDKFDENIFPGTDDAIGLSIPCLLSHLQTLKGQKQPSFQKSIILVGLEKTFPTDKGAGKTTLAAGLSGQSFLCQHTDSYIVADHLKRFKFQMSNGNKTVFKSNLIKSQLEHYPQVGIFDISIIRSKDNIDHIYSEYQIPAIIKINQEIAQPKKIQIVFVLSNGGFGDRGFTHLIEIINYFSRYSAIPFFEQCFNIVFTKGLTVKYLLENIKQAKQYLQAKLDLAAMGFLKILTKKLNYYQENYLNTFLEINNPMNFDFRRLADFLMREKDTINDISSDFIKNYIPKQFFQFDKICQEKIKKSFHLFRKMSLKNFQRRNCHWTSHYLNQIRKLENILQREPREQHNSQKQIQDFFEDLISNQAQDVKLSEKEIFQRIESIKRFLDKVPALKEYPDIIRIVGNNLTQIVERLKLAILILMGKGRKIFKICPNIFQKPNVQIKNLSQNESLQWNNCYSEIFYFWEQRKKQICLDSLQKIADNLIPKNEIQLNRIKKRITKFKGIPSDNLFAANGKFFRQNELLEMYQSYWKQNSVKILGEMNFILRYKKINLCFEVKNFLLGLHQSSKIDQTFCEVANEIKKTICSMLHQILTKIQQEIRELLNNIGSIDGQKEIFEILITNRSQVLQTLQLSNPLNIESNIEFYTSLNISLKILQQILLGQIYSFSFDSSSQTSQSEQSNSSLMESSIVPFSDSPSQISIGFFQSQSSNSSLKESQMGPSNDSSSQTSQSQSSNSSFKESSIVPFSDSSSNKDSSIFMDQLFPKWSKQDEQIKKPNHHLQYQIGGDLKNFQTVIDLMKKINRREEDELSMHRGQLIIMKSEQSNPCQIGKLQTQISTSQSMIKKFTKDRQTQKQSMSKGFSALVKEIMKKIKRVVKICAKQYSNMHAFRNSNTHSTHRKLISCHLSLQKLEDLASRYFPSCRIPQKEPILQKIRSLIASYVFLQQPCKSFEALKRLFNKYLQSTKYIAEEIAKAEVQFGFQVVSSLIEPGHDSDSQTLKEHYQHKLKQKTYEVFQANQSISLIMDLLAFQDKSYFQLTFCRSESIKQVSQLIKRICQSEKFSFVQVCSQIKLVYQVKKLLQTSGKLQDFRDFVYENIQKIVTMVDMMNRRLRQIKKIMENQWFYTNLRSQLFALLYQEFKLLQSIIQNLSPNNIRQISENSQENFPDCTFQSLISKQWLKSFKQELTQITQMFVNVKSRKKALVMLKSKLNFNHPTIFYIFQNPLCEMAEILQTQLLSTQTLDPNARLELINSCHQFLNMTKEVNEFTSLRTDLKLEEFEQVLEASLSLSVIVNQIEQERILKSEYSELDSTQQHNQSSLQQVSIKIKKIRKEKCEKMIEKQYTHEMDSIACFDRSQTIDDNEFDSFYSIDDSISQIGHRQVEIKDVEETPPNQYKLPAGDCFTFLNNDMKVYVQKIVKFAFPDGLFGRNEVEITFTVNDRGEHYVRLRTSSTVEPLIIYLPTQRPFNFQ